MSIFFDIVEHTFKVFMDDVLKFRESYDDCLHNLENMFKIYEETNLVLNYEKCYFMVQKGIVLVYRSLGKG